MADDTTDTTAPPSAAGMDPALLQRLLGQLTAAPPPAPPQPSASSHEGRGFLSLLGEALGGGQQYGSTAEREQGGLAAAQALGARMMQASDWSYQPHTLGSIIGQGYGAARESLGQTQAVSAARAAAAYDQQRQGQQDQLARLKEAIPLLTLQQQQSLLAKTAAQPSSLAGGGGIGGVGGGDGSFLSALASIESGDTNIVSRVDKDSKGLTLAQGGNPAEISQGHFQINPGTWRDFAKAAGVDTTQYPTPMSAPREVQAQVASVIPLARFGPRTQEMLRQKFGDLDTSRTIGALNGARAPAAPGQQPGAAPLPPAVKVAGPGAGNLPTPLIPPASPPQPPGQPIAGPPSVEPETGLPVAGGGPPGAATPSPSLAAPPAAAPDMPEFQYTPRPIPAALLPSGGLSPAEQVTFNQARAAYENAIHIPGITPQQRQAAETVLQKTLDSQLTVQAGHAKELSDAIVKFGEADYKQQDATFQEKLKAAIAQQAATVEDQRKQEDARRTQANAIILEQERGKQARDTEAAKIEGNYVVGQRNEFDKARGDIRGNLDNFQMLRAFSDAAGKSTALENMEYGGKSGRDILVQAGMGTQAQREKWGTQQAFQGLINKTIMGLRGGFSMGALSDRDMDFLKNLAPNQMQDPQTRSDIISYLEQAEFRKRDYMNKVEDLYDNGNGMKWWQAKRAADAALPDFVVKMPVDFDKLPPPMQHQFLRENNLRHGNIVRLQERSADGTVHPGKLSRIELGGG
jgi:hypothetical protein